jgi:hypothetical protein
MKPIQECSQVKEMQQLKNHKRLGRSPTDAQVGISCLQGVP